MQTFLPYRSYYASAEVLDNRRLGKQRIEAMQIYKIITAPAEISKNMAWTNHPAVRMWRGYSAELALYYDNIREEWLHRGFKNTMPKLMPTSDAVKLMLNRHDLYPPWLDEEFCSAHRAALLYKDPTWYAKFQWAETPRIKYIWPVT